MENKEFDYKKIKTLDDCVNVLNEIAEADPEGFKEWKSMLEETALGVSHHGLGTFLRNELHLWHDGPVVKWFNERGIFHADDMSGIILTTYHRQCNGINEDLEGQIQRYRDYWDKIDPKINKGIFK